MLDRIRTAQSQFFQLTALAGHFSDYAVFTAADKATAQVVREHTPQRTLQCWVEDTCNIVPF